MSTFTEIWWRCGLDGMRVGMVGANAEASVFVKGRGIADDRANRLESVALENGVDEKRVGIREYSNVNPFSG